MGSRGFAGQLPRIRIGPVNDITARQADWTLWFSRLIVT